MLRFVRPLTDVAARSVRMLCNGRSGRGYSLFVEHKRASSSTAGAEESIVAAVVLERLPVVLPRLAPEVSAFRQFSFDWQQQFRRHYPQEFLDDSASAHRGENEENETFEPGPTITEADRKNDTRSLQRFLDKRLYLVLHGVPSGSTERESVWHFPQKVYSKEPTLRQCAEAALGSVIGDLSKSVFFVGNAPCGHLSSSVLQSPVEQTQWVSKRRMKKEARKMHVPQESDVPAPQESDVPAQCGQSDVLEQSSNQGEPVVKRFFFRSQVLASELAVDKANYEDFAWISKEEVPLYFKPIEAKFLQVMLQ